MSRLRLNKFYKNTAGLKVHTLCNTETIEYGKATIAELKTPRTLGYKTTFRAFSTIKASTAPWTEISKAEFCNNSKESLHFELDKYYKHSKGEYVHTLRRIRKELPYETFIVDHVLKGGLNRGTISPANNVHHWKEVSEDEWLKYLDSQRPAKFEPNTYYRHTTGEYMHTLQLTQSDLYGEALMAESTVENGIEIGLVGVTDEGHTTGWVKISEELWQEQLKSLEDQLAVEHKYEPDQDEVFQALWAEHKYEPDQDDVDQACFCVVLAKNIGGDK